MYIKDWKNKELTTLLSEAWGFKFNTLQEFDEFKGTGEIQEEGEEEAEIQEEGEKPEDGEEDLEEGCEDTDDDGDELEEDSFPGKRDMEQHKSDLSETRLREIIRMALKEKANNG